MAGAADCFRPAEPDPPRHGTAARAPACELAAGGAGIHQLSPGPVYGREPAADSTRSGRGRMRRRSITGPLMLLLIGCLFLWRNLHPDWPLFDTLARFWPFILIAWGTLRLIEVLFTRRRGYTTFTGGEVALVVLICIAGSAIWQARQHGIRFNNRGLDVFGEQYDYPVSAKASAAGMTRITFENPRGNLKVSGTDANEVTVNGRKLIRAWSRRDADQSDANTPVEIVPQGDRLLIRTNQDRVPDSQRISADLEVTVPKGVFVEARGRSGDYEVTDITGNVELASSRSDVRLE